MRILLISTPHERTPPLTSGGIERIVALLANGLVERGHEVTLFATGDSQTRASLRSYFPHGIRPYSLMNEAIQVGLALRRAGAYDIVHNHCFLGAAFCDLSGTASLTTLHWTFDEAHEPLFRAFPQHGVVALSEWQRRAMPGLNYLGVVPNAVDLDEYEFRAEKEEYLLFVGRMDPRKGPHLAARAARVTGLPLVLAGKLKPENQPFFDREVAPHLSDRIRYVGEVGGEERRALFAGARALLLPVQWEEPFGLVLIEAMASGTPVIALRRGAIPEVVVEGVTGFIRDDPAELPDAIARVSAIDPAACRAHVAEHYSAPAMVAAYEAIYRRVARTES